VPGGRPTRRSSTPRLEVAQAPSTQPAAGSGLVHVLRGGIAQWALPPGNARRPGGRELQHDRAPVILTRNGGCSVFALAGRPRHGHLIRPPVRLVCRVRRADPAIVVRTLAGAAVAHRSAQPSRGAPARRVANGHGTDVGRPCRTAVRYTLLSIILVTHGGVRRRSTKPRLLPGQKLSHRFRRSSAGPRCGASIPQSRQDVEELIAYSKAHPGRIMSRLPATASIPLARGDVTADAVIDIITFLYRGPAGRARIVRPGRCRWSSRPSRSCSAIEAGKLIAPAPWRTETRNPQLPDVPDHDRGRGCRRSKRRSGLAFARPGAPPKASSTSSMPAINNSESQDVERSWPAEAPGEKSGSPRILPFRCRAE